MLASANQTKPLHFFRRFVEGWFSVYLSIFLVTLAVRLLFFTPEAHPVKSTALANSKLKTRHIVKYSFRHVHFSEPTAAGVENAVSFGAVNQTN